MPSVDSPLFRDLQVFFHLRFITIIRGSYYSPHVIDEKTILLVQVFIYSLKIWFSN